MSARHLQFALAAIFIGLGGWCLLMPHLVETLVLKPQYQHLSPASALWIGCFGAQAVLVGIVIATSEFRARTFLFFGLAGSLPFFVFNWYFYFVAEMFTAWMLLDFVGNRERRAVKWNHSAEVVLRQDLAVRRRPYRAYGQAGRRRSWRKTARPFGFASGGRPLCRMARAIPHITLRPSPGGSDRRTANRIDSISPYAALGILACGLAGWRLLSRQEAGAALP